MFSNNVKFSKIKHYIQKSCIVKIIEHKYFFKFYNHLSTLIFIQLIEETLIYSDTKMNRKYNDF